MKPGPDAFLLTSSSPRPLGVAKGLMVRALPVPVDSWPVTMLLG